MRTRVKICGITRAEDAGLAAAAGADAIGFVFWPKSPRAATPAQAAAIWTAGALIARVGVFVNESPAIVRDVVREARLTAVQLHGDEQVEDYLSCAAPLIKAVSLSDAASVSVAAALPAHVTLMVDASDHVRRGGTGQLADWARAAELARVRPIILAGGLTPANVADAIRQVQPWAIDVSSGVEIGPGIKNAASLTALFGAIGSAMQEAR
ncbi:MAG TPA: phosphoribosylanthranilate isomerase [Vicinamibacterales bacterium]|nr:phosphoribosylanthranilate isomerase [Vicinamibacterales bacterium]